MPKLTFCGHACFLVETSSNRVLIDPFLTGNPTASHSVDQMPPVSAIVVSHGHGDHLGDAVEIAKRDGAPVVATYELATLCQQQGAEAVAMNIGGKFDLGWGSVKLVQAWHSSSFQTSEGFVYTGMPTGIILSMEGKTVYHLGDTCLFSDLELISRRNGPIDVALIPIGDHFTMGIEDAVEAVRMIQPGIAVPMHYNTFPPISQDPALFSLGVAEQGGRVVTLQPGGVIEF
jgi:L-ascorbate metabolism protein UlaG (beta-lactamase superfamily)